MADQFKPVVPWPHVEGVEVDLDSIRQKNGDKPDPAFKAQNQQNVIQKQYITFKPHTNVYSEPVLKKGVLGNFEPKEPEPQGAQGGPGEGSKAFVLGPEYKDSVQASIKEFGFNMVASDMISLDRTVDDLRHEEWVWGCRPFLFVNVFGCVGVVVTLGFWTFFALFLKAFCFTRY